MIQFEVGKSYEYHSVIYTVTKRTARFVSFSLSVGTKMRKELHSEGLIEYVYLGNKGTGIFHAVSEVVNNDSQPEPATAEITTSASDNDNAPASQSADVATTHSNTADSAKSLLSPDYFKGKSFDEIKQAFSGATLKQLKGFALCYTIPYFNRMNKSKLIDALASKISLILETRYGYMTAENVTGEGGYAQQDDIIIPAPKPRSIPQPVTVKFIPGTVYYGNDSGNHFPVKILSITDDGYATTDCISALIKYAKIQTVAGVEYAVFPTQYRNIEIWADKPESAESVQSETSANHDNLSQFEIGKTYIASTLLNSKNQELTVKSISIGKNGERFADFRDDCNTGFIMGINTDKNGNEYACMKRYSVHCHSCTEVKLPPENLYDDDSFSDTPGDNSHPEQDIPERRENDSISYNPGLTVIPSEHISRPPYRSIHDTPLDDIPCVNIPACDIPTHSPAAVVPYSQAASIRNFFRLIAIYLRMWLAMHLTPDNDAIRSHVFAPWFIELADYAPGNPNDTSPFLYKWNRKKFSEKLKLCRTQIATCKDREEIIACLQYVSSESIRLFCVADRVLNKFERIYANSECERKLAYAQIYADKIIQRRKKAITVRAEINDITPKIEDKGSLPHDFIHDFARAKFHEDRMRLLETLSLEQLRYLAQSEHISLHGECVEHDCACYILNETESRFCMLDTGDWPQCKDTPITAAKRKWDEECAIRLATDIEKHKKKISRKSKPAQANDSAHKLINLDGLHETERRNARNHNIALLSACMFPEAVISLLMSATVHTVKALGLHLGYMCKATKGDKKFLAEKFADEMFRIRNLKKSPVAQARQTAKTPAHVPDGVKFEVNKKRQICFTFED